MKKILVCLIMLSLTGCVGMRAPQRSRDIQETESNYYEHDDMIESEVSASLKFEDIPVPVGFNLIIKDSFVFNNDFTRVGIVEYEGRGDINNITSFFKKQMPLFNWEMINSIEYSKSVINFEKEGQSCTIIIEQLNRNYIKFTIASGPRK